MLYDIRKAHRLVPIVQKDWGTQAFQLDDDKEPRPVYLNTVGTFGITSAAFWWSRVSSGAVRLVHYLLGPMYGIFHLLYADDGLMVGRGRNWARALLLVFLIYDLLEIPMAWNKVRGGFKVEWIGYTFDVSCYEVGISLKKVDWVKDWVEKHIQSGMIAIRDFKAGLGRLTFVCGALSHAKSFLGPMFAWSSAAQLSTCLAIPGVICVLLRWLSEKIQAKPMRVCRNSERT